MTAKEIIIKLVDEGKISGEEAFILIDAIKAPSIINVPYPVEKYYPWRPWWNDIWYGTTISDTTKDGNNITTTDGNGITWNYYNKNSDSKLYNTESTM